MAFGIWVLDNSVQLSGEDGQKISVGILLEGRGDEIFGHLDVMFECFRHFASLSKSFDGLGQGLIVICDDNFGIFS